MIGHAGAPVLRASFVCVQGDCRLQVQAVGTRLWPQRSPTSPYLPAPAPTHRLCSWVHTLWLESNDIGPAVSLPLRNAFARNLHLSIASDPGPTVCVYRGPRNSQRGCACTLASLTCHWLKTPCAPKDWSTSAKRWRVSFPGCVFLYLLSRLTTFWRRLYREFACADGNCPLFTLNIRNTQVIRLPLCIQETKMLKEIVSEDNPLLFPPREVQQMRVRRVLACMSVCN